jgi:putative ABC transport system permease protein
MAMALVLLTASAAAVGALIEASKLNLGFGNTRTVGASVTLPRARFGVQPAMIAYVDDALARLRAAPGVRRAAATGVLPGNSETGVGLGLTRPGQDAPPVFATYLSASPDYFAVLGIPVIAGRGFSETDRLGAPTALILSDSTARKLFGDSRMAVGAALNLRLGREPVRCEVVGVVADVRMKGLDADARSLQQMYVALAQQPPYGTLSFVAEIDAEHAAAQQALAESIASVDPSVPVYGLQALDDVADRYLASYRLAGTLVSGFAVITLVVAAIGLYGLVSQVVGERMREMGIRMALGANPRRLRTEFVIRAVALAGCGAIAGAIAAAGGLSLIGSVVPGLAKVPASLFVANIGVLIASAACAAWGPSARISSIDPMRVMGD